MIETVCTYDGGEPCEECPRQITALHRCGILQEIGKLMNEPTIDNTEPCRHCQGPAFPVSSFGRFRFVCKNYESRNNESQLDCGDASRLPYVDNMNEAFVRWNTDNNTGA